MEYKLDIDAIKKSYAVDEIKKTLKHNTGKRINILPYNTKYKKHKYKNSIEKFDLTVGNFSRLISCREITNNFIDDNWLDTTIKNVSADEEGTIFLKHFVKDIFFNKNSFEFFHPLIYNYIGINEKVSSFETKNAQSADFNQKLSIFLYNILIDSEDPEMKNLIEQVYQYQHQNILISLVIKALPPLRQTERQKKQSYKSCFDFVKSLFIEDFKFMLSDSNLFLNNFEIVLKYYYFFYVSQLSLKFRDQLSMNVTKPEPLYFTLEWESTGRSRTSYNSGWKYLSGAIQQLFSHANCLELLNHTTSNTGSYSYHELSEVVKNMSQTEIGELKKDLQSLIELYIKCVNDVEWRDFHRNEKYENEIYNAIYELFSRIDFQFNNSSRKEMYNYYMMWFEEFCKINFLKQRGQLGYTLNLSEEYLIVITKLCIKNNDKIRLKLLFNEYERRGIYFDKDSKKRIVQLFEKLNLIEKKSDSGDAQYVKFIL